MTEIATVEDAGPVDSDALRMLSLFINRFERLSDEIAGLQDDRKDVLKEAKGHGFDPKALREVIRRRKMEPHLRDEMDALVDVYESALTGIPRGSIDGGELTVAAPPRALPAPRRKGLDEAMAWAESPEPDGLTIRIGGVGS